MNRLVVVLLAGTLLPILAHAFVQGDGRLFQERHQIAEIPAAGTKQGIERLGVKLPLGAKVPKVEVFADTADHGENSDDWAKCNIESMTCEIGDVHIVRFHRINHDSWQELSVDLASENQTAVRHVKLLVTYEPVAGLDLKGCKLNTDCGYAKFVPAGSE